MGEISNISRKVAIYGRVSSEHETQLSAFNNQVKWYENQVLKHPEWNIVEKYFDKGITGTQAKKRPGFVKMIKDAQAGKFDLIITREVSRFARNTLDAIKYTRELKAMGVEVLFISDNISTSDGDGEIRLTNMASYAQDESRKMSERVKAGQYIARIEKNVLYGSGNIIGYNRVGKTFIIDEEQAKTVKMIFKLYLEGNGLKAIKAELLKAGRKNSKGDLKWYGSTISRMLANPMYIGKQYQNQTTVVDFLEHKVKRNNKSEYIQIKGDFKPIISVKDFEKVQEIKNDRVMKKFSCKTYGSKLANDRWMNLLECGCGSRYQHYKWRKYKKTGEIVRGYACRNRINNGNTKYRLDKNLPLDEVCDNKTVSDWHLELMLKDILEDIWDFRKESVIKVFELIKENFVYDKDSDASKIKELNFKIKKYKQKSSKLVDLYTDGAIEKIEFINKKGEYNEFIKIAEDELRQIKGGLALVEKNLEKKLQHIRKELEQLINFDVEKLDKDIINQFVDKVIVRSNNKFEWLLNISNIEIKNLFNNAMNEKIEIKRERTIQVRDANYTLAFNGIINIDKAKAYRKKYNKYLREDKWTDINYSVYVR